MGGTERTGGVDPGGSTSAVVPVDLRDWVRFTPAEATRVRVLATDTLALDLWCIEPQQATPVLRLGVDATYTVVGGRSWFVTEDGEVGLDPLGSLLVPAGTAHGIDNRAPDPLVVVAVTAPPDAEPDVTVPATDASTPGPAVRPPSGGGILGRLAGRLRPPGPGATDAPAGR